MILHSPKPGQSDLVCCDLIGTAVLSVDPYSQFIIGLAGIFTAGGTLISILGAGSGKKKCQY